MGSRRSLLGMEGRRGGCETLGGLCGNRCSGRCGDGNGGWIRRVWHWRWELANGIGDSSDWLMAMDYDVDDDSAAEEEPHTDETESDGGGD